MVKNLPATGRPVFNPWVGKIPWRRAWQPTAYSYLENPHGERCLVGYCPCGCKESDVTEQLSTAQAIYIVIDGLSIAMCICTAMQKQKVLTVCWAPSVLIITNITVIIITTLLKVKLVGTQRVLCFSCIDVHFLQKWVLWHLFTSTSEFWP